ncbi:MAG TPA: class D sortase [Blastocatellia bacterium]|nr:class D sortase [Blastocatellia bacterium]
MYLPIPINPILAWSRNIFVIIGFLLLSYTGYVLFEAQLYQADQTRKFEQALKNKNMAHAANTGLPVREGSSLGQIRISQIGLTAMIQEGTGEETLQRAVGHVQGTSLPGQHGNIALAGHRDTFFRGLRQIRLGDEITLTTFSGSYRYRVESTKVVEPEETEVLDPATDDILTLVTCYPFNFVGSAPKRFIVLARKILI